MRQGLLPETASAFAVIGLCAPVIVLLLPTLDFYRRRPQPAMV